MPKCQKCDANVPRLFPIKFRNSQWSSMFYDVCSSCYLDYSKVVERWIAGEFEPEEDDDEEESEDND